jgi:hypothetical protein
MTKHWNVTVAGNLDEQNRFSAFCEDFMSYDMTIIRRWVPYEFTLLMETRTDLQVTCRMTIDPTRPIDSTGSMPSFVEQILDEGFEGVEVEQVEDGRRLAAFP